MRYKAKMNNQKIKILILSAGAISGSFRMMAEIIENINRGKFHLYITYKPDFSEWGQYEIDLICNAGATLIPLRGKRLFDIRGFWDLWNALKSERIDILHSWDVLGVPARIIGKLAGVKIIEEFANPPPKLISVISLKHYWINKYTSVFVDGYIACSFGILKRFREQESVFFNNKLTAVVHNCVDVPDLTFSKDQICSIKRRYSIRESDKVIINIGHFSKQKAQDDLLKAFRTVANNRSDVRLVIIGWGTLEVELKKLTKTLKLENKVIFTGKLLRPQVFEVLSITDLFVLSSHWEGFGIVLAEAMALGKAVISTDTDGSREVVENGKTGILVPIENSQILAEAILDLLEKPDLMIQMGKRGLERVTKYFNCDQYIKGYEAFYKSVLSR